MSAPRISVIGFCDPSHINHGALFIDHLARQDLPLAEFELIIADDQHCADFRAATSARAAQSPELAFRYIDVERPGRAAAINAGVALARAPVIAILADDAMAAPAALAAHLAFHDANPDPLAVSIGPMLFADALREDGFRRWLEDSGSLFGMSLRRQFTRWTPDFFYCGNCAMKRTLFDRIGGFDERFTWITWDDFEFGQRLVAAGGYTQYVSAAIAWHEHRVTLPERLQSMRTGGHAACLHERLGAPARPWSVMLDAARARRGETLADDDETLPLSERIAIFEAHLHRAFLEGYEAAQRYNQHGIDAATAPT